MFFSTKPNLYCAEGNIHKSNILSCVSLYSDFRKLEDCTETLARKMVHLV